MLSLIEAKDERDQKENENCYWKFELGHGVCNGTKWEREQKGRGEAKWRVAEGEADA